VNGLTWNGESRHIAGITLWPKYRGSLSPHLVRSVLDAPTTTTSMKIALLCQIYARISEEICAVSLTSHTHAGRSHAFLEKVGLAGTSAH
jgi:hypothetical protein